MILCLLDQQNCCQVLSGCICDFLEPHVRRDLMLKAMSQCSTSAKGYYRRWQRFAFESWSFTAERVNIWRWIDLYLCKYEFWRNWRALLCQVVVSHIILYFQLWSISQMFFKWYGSQNDKHLEVGLAMHASCWICLDAVEALPQQSYSASFFFYINPKRYAIVYPIPSMYGIFTCIWLIFMVNVGEYTVHGCFGYTNPIPSDRINFI